ncbi:hypothetical protein BS50DRAFT_652680, partial [Corynespora cassiicola Philippines]
MRGRRPTLDGCRLPAATCRSRSRCRARVDCLRAGTQHSAAREGATGRTAAGARRLWRLTLKSLRRQRPSHRGSAMRPGEWLVGDEPSGRAMPDGGVIMGRTGSSRSISEQRAPRTAATASLPATRMRHGAAAASHQPPRTTAHGQRDHGQPHRGRGRGHPHPQPH